MLERILVIINTIDAGGAESFVMKTFRNLNRDRFVYDFLINTKGREFYKEEIQSLGGRIFYGYPKSKHLFKCYKRIRDIVRDEKYRIVFVIAVHPVGFLDLFAAKRGGAKVRIIRSTNSKAGGCLSELLAVLGRILVRKLATRMIAPSSEAGKWMFGKKALKDHKVDLVPNGIDPVVYKYDEHFRNNIRNELNISSDKTIIGHIGRFNTQKNHKYLIDIFYEYKKLNNNAVLLLTGDGDLRNEIQKKVVSLEISDSVLFLGIRNDVPQILMAMDIMLLPSFYEGMPNVVIEAQSVGLPCLISDRITKEAKITDLVRFKSIEIPPSEWALEISRIIGGKMTDREHYNKEIYKHGYNICNSVRMLESYYEEGVS